MEQMPFENLNFALLTIGMTLCIMSLDMLPSIKRKRVSK
jgi:hypothetical protein